MLIIADDITGAAEIAGIAWRKGLKVRLMVYQPKMPTTPLSSWRGAGGEALILATDTRSGTEEEAVKTIEELATCLYSGVQECRSVGVQTLPSSTSNSSTCKALNSSTEKILLLCGSTQSRSLIGEPFFANKNAIEVTMPEDVFHGTASILETNAWIATLKDHWQNHDAMIVRIGHEATGGKEYAVRLRNLFGELAYQILSPVQGVQECRSEGVQTLPDQGVQECRSVGVQTLPPSTSNLSTCQLKQATCQLVNSSTETSNSSTRQLVNLSTCEALNSSTRIIIEGGATAYAVLERLGISSFDVEYEYSPGVVCLSHGNMRIILKPGSYPWGNLFEEL